VPVARDLLRTGGAGGNGAKADGDGSVRLAPPPPTTDATDAPTS
jgi:hypothetical protein